MPRPRPASRIAAVACVALALLVAACSTDTTDDAPSADERKQLFGEQCEDAVIPDLPDLAPVAGEPGERKVKSDFGTVELPGDPKAALGMYTTDLDILIWLRYPLAKSQPIRDFGYTTFPCFFPYDALEGIGTFVNFPEYDFEKVLQAEPDFILNGLGYDKKTVRRLPQIAPTYNVNAFDGKSWLTHFEQTAKALGREQYFQEWKTLYDERVAALKKDLGDTSGIVVSPFSYWDDSVQVHCLSNVECQVFDDLGLTIAAPAVADDGEGRALSGEQLGQLKDVDYAFTPEGLDEDSKKAQKKTLDEIAKNALWSDLEFVKKNQLISFEIEVSYGSPSGALAFLDVVRKALVK